MSQGAEKSEQDAKLQAQKNIQAHAFHMKRCLDNTKLMDALKHASDMLGELRTSLLGPKDYYELYILAFQELRFLESYIYEESTKSSRKVAELYELVQYAGNVVPRLYLLITVGSVYIKSLEAPAKDVLRDLVEMTKGVQHPTRGLFLRHYLAEMTKDKLPDEGTEFAGTKGGNVTDCVDFVLRNFVEMNQLWVRMQHQGRLRERQRRERERRELGPLIGKMLSRLSNLDGMTMELYAEQVLPQLVDQITNCKDAIAQEYLMECMVQVFPDEYHLHTLEKVLDAISSVVQGVDVKSIIVNFIDRLVRFVKQNKDKLQSSSDMFQIFYGVISRITQERSELKVEDVLALYKSLMDLTIQVYPGNLENVDKIFSVASSVLSERQQANAASLADHKVVNGLVALLKSPLDNYHNILTVLALQNYPKLFQFLKLSDRRRICLVVVKSVIEDGVNVPTVDHVNALLQLLLPLIKDPEEGSADAAEELDEPDPLDFAEEQNLVGSLVHFFRSDDPDASFENLVTVRKYFGQGGTSRIRHTIPPLLFRTIEVARAMAAVHSSNEAAWHERGARIFKFLLGTAKTFAANVSLPDLSFRIFLHCAQSAGECGFEGVAYQFVEKAYGVYEEDITDSAAKLAAMNLMIATLYSISGFSEENFENIVTKTAQHSSRVLKKHDQCLLVYLVSHLFWLKEGSYREGDRVLECLQKSVRIAKDMAESQEDLFVEILNKYLYYFESGNDKINPQFLNSLVELVAGKLTEAEELSSNVLYRNTLAYIRRKKEEDPAKYGELAV